MDRETIKSKEIGLFKLVTGEEIVAECEYLNGSYKLKKARSVGLAQHPKTREIFPQLGPWIITEQDDDYRISEDKILVKKVPVSPQLEAAYLQNTTGIDVATAASNIQLPK